MMIITQKITSLAYEIHDGKYLEIIWAITITFCSLLEERKDGGKMGKF